MGLRIAIISVCGIIEDVLFSSEMTSMQYAGMKIECTRRGSALTIVALFSSPPLHLFVVCNPDRLHQKFHDLLPSSYRHPDGQIIAVKLLKHDLYELLQLRMN